MEQFFGFAFPGITYGCTSALVAVCLVLTYQATGVFNFAFGAQAFASAFVFTYLTEYHNWSGFEAFLLSVVVMGPVVGWAFDRFLFRHIGELEHHGEDGVQPRAPGRHPVVAAGDLRSTEPRRDRHHPSLLQSERRLLHPDRPAGQRDRSGDHLGDSRGAGPPHDPAALHQSRTADAGRRRESSARPARRDQCQRGGRRGLDHLELHGQLGGRPPGAELQSISLRTTTSRSPWWP